MATPPHAAVVHTGIAASYCTTCFIAGEELPTKLALPA